jgi:hypothetical protein
VRIEVEAFSPEPAGDCSVDEVGETAAPFEVRDELSGRFPVAGQVEGVDSRGELT